MFVDPNRFSVLYPLQPDRITDVAAFGRLLSRRGAGRLWMGHSLTLDTQHVFAYLAGLGLGVPFGSSVSLMPLRHPLDAAVAARSVAALSGAPYVAGLGPSAVNFQRAVLSAPYRRPVTAAREYLTAVRGLLAGEIVRYDGENVSLHSDLVAMRNAPPVELGLGVLRPAMAAAAGAVADVAITWLSPRRYLTDRLLPALADGATAAGRPGARVVTVVHVALDRPGRDLEAVARAGAGPQLGTEHNTAMLRLAGLDVHPDDPAAGARKLLEDNVFLTGTAEHVAAGLADHFTLGVDEVVLNPAGVMLTEGVGAACSDVEQILRAADTAARPADDRLTTAPSDARDLVSGRV